MTGKDPVSTGKEALFVLIADDEITIAETLAEFIADLGYTPMLALNGQQALTLALERWPDLIITDLMMPILDGTGLIRTLRDEAVARKKFLPPIILLSAANSRIAQNLEVNATLAKPFDLDRLEQIIDHLIGPSSR